MSSTSSDTPWWTPDPNQEKGRLLVAKTINIIHTHKYMCIYIYICIVSWLGKKSPTSHQSGPVLGRRHAGRGQLPTPRELSTVGWDRESLRPVGDCGSWRSSFLRVSKVEMRCKKSKTSKWRFVDVMFHVGLKSLEMMEKNICIYIYR